MDPETMMSGGGQPAPMGAPTGAPAEMPSDPKAVLQELMAKIDETMSKIQETQATGEQLDQNTKMEILKALFDVLQKMGVDPNDQEAVNAFLEQLKTANPEVYAAFERVLDSILEPAEQPQEPEAPMGQNPAETFPNLGGGMPGQAQEGGMPMPGARG